MNEPNQKTYRSPFIPILLLALAIVCVLAFQSIQLVHEKENLANLRTAQDEPFAEAQRLRTQLDGIAGDTAALAQRGNENARRVVEELAKRGINIKPSGATAVGE